MKRPLLLLSLSFVVIPTLCGRALAQEASLGEASSVFSCFYECKISRAAVAAPYWRETTTLMLAKQSNRLITAQIVFLNGNEKMIATTSILLSGEDLDELNVCRTLQANDVPVPQAGLIEVVQFDSLTGLPTVGAYGWVKNLLGRFLVNQDEPFAGAVTGIAKTECRLAPPKVITVDEILRKVEIQKPQPVKPILIEGTADRDGPTPF